MDADIEQELKSYEISVNRKDNVILLNQINLNQASVVICATNQQTHYLPCVRNGNIILSPIIDEADEPIILKSTSKITKCITYDQIPDEDSAIPISSDEESETKRILSARKSITYSKRIDYKTPFKPVKNTLRYLRKPVPHLVCKEMLQIFAKRKQRNPNLTLLDCCVMLPKCVILDPKIYIPPLEFKAQLLKTDDTTQTIRFMPATKREMNRIRTGSVKLFANPAHQFLHSNLVKLFHANCVTTKQPNDEHSTPDLLALWPALPDLIPKSKFVFAYDKKIDTNDHVYSKTSDSVFNPHAIDPISVEITDLEVIEEQLDTARVITIGSYDSDGALFESSSDEVEIESITHHVNENCEILGLESDVLFT